jgi:hypothetical protein
MTKTAFVVMPIKAEGTEEHEHFWAIYVNAIKPRLQQLGYQVVRADEIPNATNITRDIVLALAEADVVIADLTDLNPNVFYELGVRHALRAKGTVMIHDEIKTPEIPFDLAAYRVIRYKGQMQGMTKLTTELERFVQEIEKDDENNRGNPVHDWMPSLPPNAIEASLGTIEGDLRTRLRQAEQRIAKYEALYGGEAGGSPSGVVRTPQEIIRASLIDAASGDLPTKLLGQAEESVQAHDAEAFLKVISRIVERNMRLTDRQFLTLTAFSNRLGLTPVTGAIYDYALQINPRSREIRRSQLGYLAHSLEPAIRARARQEMMGELSINISEDGTQITVPDFDLGAALMLGLMLDAYHADDLDKEALALTTAALECNSHMSMVLRNHARALERNKREDEAVVYYQKAILAPDADEATMTWFGNFLHNKERLVDAAEVYLLGCLYDPDNASHFSNVADEISFALKGKHLKPKPTPKTVRQFPEDIGLEAIQLALIAAISCQAITVNDIDRMQSVAKRSGINIDQLNQSPRMSQSERFAFASTLYNALQSEITSAA